MTDRFRTHRPEGGIKSRSELGMSDSHPFRLLIFVTSILGALGSCKHRSGQKDHDSRSTVVESAENVPAEEAVLPSNDDIGLDDGSGTGLKLAESGSFGSPDSLDQAPSYYFSDPINACSDESKCNFGSASRPSGLETLYAIGRYDSAGTGYGLDYFTYPYNSTPLFMITEKTGPGLAELFACKDLSMGKINSYFLSLSPDCEGLGKYQDRLTSHVYTEQGAGMIPHCRPNYSPFISYGGTYGCGSDTTVGYVYPLYDVERVSIYPSASIGQLVVGPIIDTLSKKPVANETFTLSMFGGSGRVSYQTSAASDSAGNWVSPHIAYARGLDFKLCVSGQAKIRFAGLQAFIRLNSESSQSCIVGRFSDIIASVTNVASASVTLPPEFSVDIYEWITTKQYCPVDPMVITSDTLTVPTLPTNNFFDPNYLTNLAINAAFKGVKLAICKNLDANVKGQVVDAESSAPIVNAKVTVKFSDASNRSLSDSYATDSLGAFTSVKFSRFRGQNLKVCATAKDYPEICQTVTAAASLPTTLMTGTCGTNVNCYEPIKLVHNVKPIGRAGIDGLADASGSYPKSSLLKGYAIDPDVTGPIALRLKAKIPVINPKTCEKSMITFQKDFNTDVISAEACARYQAIFPDVCTNLVGFAPSFQDLGLPDGAYSLNVSALNPARVLQQPEDSEFVDLAGSPVKIKIGAGSGPAPFCGGLSFLLNASTFAKQGMKINLSRVLADSQELMKVRICEDKGGTLNTAYSEADATTCIAIPGQKFAPSGCSDLNLGYEPGVMSKEISVTGLKAGTAYASFLLPDGIRPENVLPIRFSTPGKAPKAAKAPAGTAALSISKNLSGNVEVSLKRSMGCVAMTAKVTLKCTTAKAFSVVQTMSLNVGEGSKSVLLSVGAGNTGRPCTASVVTTPKIKVTAVKFSLN